MHRRGAGELMDNARALVSPSAEFHRGRRDWNFDCLPGRARTKGKDERSVGYVTNASVRQACGRWPTGARTGRRVNRRSPAGPGPSDQLARTVSADCAVVLDEPVLTGAGGRRAAACASTTAGSASPTTRAAFPARLTRGTLHVQTASRRNTSGVRSHPWPAGGSDGGGPDEVLAEWLTSLRLRATGCRSLREVVVLLRELSSATPGRNLGLARFPSLADFDHRAASPAKLQAPLGREQPCCSRPARRGHAAIGPRCAGTTRSGSSPPTR